MTPTIQGLAAPAGRLLLAFIFIMAGAQKITGYAGTQGYMEMMGVPGALLPLVILIELGGVSRSCWAGRRGWSRFFWPGSACWRG